ncbi:MULTISPECIES: hypothetical protein [Vibrio harveyi group]|uniref:hypothetical protein n=1 Tax=Vibrio harveyi group TaxID=717610 RepID=UPI00111096F4|nr:hypothetical protein [Vibrio parahaemolyticus]MDG2761587.1 hypothetical protein [Vibrio parahaemolyticus]TMX40835.1 hypothetical protein DA098_03120 [Vibrio parahaemolyticus]TMX79860.1 hypothetical protein DA094_05080 [Vibrio parahaemolyticus]
MLLKDIPYGSDFKLNGKRYSQFIRPKRPKHPNDFNIVCYQPPQGAGEDIHCMTEVVPIQSLRPQGISVPIKTLFIGGSKDNCYEMVNVYKDQQFISVNPLEEMPPLVASMGESPTSETYQVEHYLLRKLKTNKATLHVAVLEELDLVKALVERLTAYSKCKTESVSR